MTVRWSLNGWRSTKRREAIVEGGFWLTTPDGALLRGRPYKLKPTVYLMSMPIAFEVEIEGGLQKGVAGDFLAMGPRGELFVVRKADAVLYEELAELNYTG